MPTILGIESTCDETGAAVVDDGTKVRSNVVASQVSLHEKYRGVVPEIASRAHVQNILPVMREAMSQANCTFDDLEAIAVSHRPGLIGSLLIGVTAAKTLAWSMGKPLIGVDHVHAHLYSVTLGEAPAIELPAVGLVISGGHTSLYRVGSWTDITLLGSTIDDAVGEAYDKVAAILGLGYPGGPVVDILAGKGDPKAIRFPRSMLGRDSLDFSFSGLKTAVLYHVRGVPKRGESRAETTTLAPPPASQKLFDICASFQASCIDTLVKKMRRAAERVNARSIIIGGGVSANRGLRDVLKNFDLPVFFPPMQYCTDNAAMSAGLADVLLDAGHVSNLDLDAVTYSQFRA